MSLETWIKAALDRGASDLHLEGGMPLCVRVRGQLRMIGDPLVPAQLTAAARALLTEAQWAEFRERHSADLSRNVAGVRCRINVLQSARGVGMAVRLLTGFSASIAKLNLHPDLARLVQPTHGLVLVAGATGSGKSTTVAALLQEINQNEARHIVTVESPIEYVLQPRKSLIRQREVGRDTPSFSQALIDALRQDPDVLVVGEMRDPETMRLTLSAAETGHLVLATVHSGTCAEALARVVGSFGSEAQPAVAAQLADVLVATVCQRLSYRMPGSDRLVPELEILHASVAARAAIRSAQWSKLQTVLETGGIDGCFTFNRYREWLDRRRDFYVVSDKDSEPLAEMPSVDAELPRRPLAAPPKPVVLSGTKPAQATPNRPAIAAAPGPVLEIGDDGDDPLAILHELERRRR